MHNILTAKLPNFFRIGEIGSSLNEFDYHAHKKCVHGSPGDVEALFDYDSNYDNVQRF